MVGYYDKPDATNDIIKVHADGQRWLHTGDLGYMTEDGIIYVSGRIKRIIMTKGTEGVVTKMFPDRIEKVILQHPAVAACCVIGVPDANRIHYPKAYVVLQDTHSESSHLKTEIQSICNNLLPDYMQPESIEFCIDFPRTDRGKVDYRTLEKEAEKQ